MRTIAYIIALFAVIGSIANAVAETLSGGIDSMRAAQARLENDANKSDKSAVRSALDLAKAAKALQEQSDGFNIKVRQPAMEAVKNIRSSAEQAALAANAGKTDEVRQLVSQSSASLTKLNELFPPKNAKSQDVANDSVESSKPAVAAAKQGIKDAGNANCPVTGQPVGSMEKGASVVYGGYKIGLCCSGCASTVKQDGEKYLKIALKK